MDLILETELIYLRRRELLAARSQLSRHPLYLAMVFVYFNEPVNNLMAD